MFLALGFIGKWTQWYRVLCYRRALDVFILCAMGCGWRAAEGEDASWLEWVPRATQVVLRRHLWRRKNESAGGALGASFSCPG